MNDWKITVTVGTWLSPVLRKCWIRVNLLHPQPSLFLYGLILSLRCFSILLNYYFLFSFNFKVILYLTKITQNNLTKLSLACVIMCISVPLLQLPSNKKDESSSSNSFGLAGEREHSHLRLSSRWKAHRHWCRKLVTSATSSNVRWRMWTHVTQYGKFIIIGGEYSWRQLIIEYHVTRVNVR